MTPEEEIAALTSQSDEDVCKVIASRVRQLRLDSKHTQATLAALANVPLRTFKRFEVDGKASLETFIRILRALDRAQYLYLLLPSSQPRVSSAYEEKISNARKRWQHPHDRE
jgi:hypothetical protein